MKLAGQTKEKPTPFSAEKRASLHSLWEFEATRCEDVLVTQDSFQWVLNTSMGDKSHKWQGSILRGRNCVLYAKEGHSRYGLDGPLSDILERFYQSVQAARMITVDHGLKLSSFSSRMPLAGISCLWAFRKHLVVCSG